MIRKFTLLLAAVSLAAASYAQAGSGIYLRGDATGSWDTSADWEFTDEGNGVYTLTDKTLKAGQFKIADQDFSATNLGASGDGLFSPNYSYNLAQGSQTNMVIDDEFLAKKITLTKNESATTLLIEGEFTNIPEKMYVIGEVTEFGFSTEKGLELTKSEDGKTFTGEITTFNDGALFALSSAIGFTGDNAWIDLNANRFGGRVNNYGIFTATNFPVAKFNGGDNNFSVKYAGTYTLTVNMATRTISMQLKGIPEELYLIGDVNGSTFNDEVVNGNCQLATAGDGVFTIDNVTVGANDAEFGYVSFVSVLAPSLEQWNMANNFRYGPAENNTLLEDKVASEINNYGETSYKLEAGTYYFTVDFNKFTVTAEKQGTSGVVAATTNAATKAVASKGLISIEGEPAEVSVYTTAGQAIATRSTATEFSVPAGLYIVVIDNTATKLLVP